MCIHIHLRCTFHYQYLFVKTFMCLNIHLHIHILMFFIVLGLKDMHIQLELFQGFKCLGYTSSLWTMVERQVQSFFCSTLSFNYCYYYYYYFPKKATKLFPWKISMFMHLWNKFNGQIFSYKNHSMYFLIGYMLWKRTLNVLANEKKCSK
jgi:hypothetical protein